jgi:hypothetical protein
VTIGVGQLNRSQWCCIHAEHLGTLGGLLEEKRQINTTIIIAIEHTNFPID